MLAYHNIFLRFSSIIMPKRFQKIINIRHYLAYQIFASFLVIIVIILAIAIALPYLDARSFNPIDEKPLPFFKSESRNTELEFNLDEIFERNLSVQTVNGYDVILVEPNSNTLRGSFSDTQTKILQEFSFHATNITEPLQRRFDSTEVYGPFLVKGNARDYYQYFVDNRFQPQREIVNQIFDHPWLMILILLGMSMPILIWLSWSIAKPVKNLRLAADAVSIGNLSIHPELEEEGVKELRRVGRSFNQMILSLQQLNTHHQRLLSDISHELKTPLTRMQLAVSLIRHRHGESNELARIENEIFKLNTMILDLLALSREQLNQHLKYEIFPIVFIWDEIFENAKFEFGQSHIKLLIEQHIVSPENYLMNGNAGMLASALENIIRNAKKYARTMVKVSLYANDTNLFIMVDDDGPGIPDGDYERIFQPFFRVEEDRARQTGGTGLGLSIVSNAVQKHNGTVLAERSELGGLRIKLQLPLWTE